MSDSFPLVYEVTLDAFSGPLDLLLHLIEQEELDIHEIAIAKVTDQYLKLLQDSLGQHLDVASDFIVMAATLLAIKARSLLPRSIDAFDEHLEDAYDEDDLVVSATELKERLLEYRLIKQVTELLQQHEGEHNDSVGRLPIPLTPYRELLQVHDHLADVDLSRMFQALATALQRVAIEYNVDVVRDRETIPQRMRKIESQLRHAPRTLVSLLKSPSRREIVTVFLAVLELIKLNRIICKQEERFGDIWIELQNK